MYIDMSLKPVGIETYVKPSVVKLKLKMYVLIRWGLYKMTFMN